MRRMCAELARLAKAAVVGDGLDAATQIGPLQNKAQFEKVKEFSRTGARTARSSPAASALRS